MSLRNNSRGLRVAALGLLALLMLATLAAPARALDNGLAAVPPMGWNTWNRFGCNVDEQLIRRSADALVSTGMKAAGYQYLIIDDCWQAPSRDAAGDLAADPQRFPSGMKALADYVHARGLKFGLYSDAGDFTCQHRPGSRGNQVRDARRFASWGVDYVKYDWCWTAGVDARTAYRAMRDAIAQSGRPMVFSLCEWGTSKPWTWARDVGHLWRTAGDIRDCFDCEGGGMPPLPPGGLPADLPPGPPPGESMPAMGLGVLQILDQEAAISQLAGPGGWNDPDMLEVGNGGMTGDEYRAHFSIWAMLAAPLIAGNDLQAMDADTRAILTNRRVIAVDQDALGRPGRRLRRDGDLDIWVRPLSDGAWAIMLLNRGRTPLPAKVQWSELGLPARGLLRVTNLWGDAKSDALRGGYDATLAPHSAQLLRVAR